MTFPLRGMNTPTLEPVSKMVILYQRLGTVLVLSAAEGSTVP